MLFVSYFVLSLQLIFGLVPTSSDTWKVVKEEDGIQVYTRITDDSPIKEVRVEMEIAADLDKFMDILNNVEGYTNWVYKCIESSKLETVSDTEFYYHTVSDFPFPVSNRDMVIHSTQHFDAERQIISTISTAMPSRIPELDGVVRIQHFESSWQITPIANNKLAIEYEARTDPGGYLPVWVINLGIASAPMQTMKRLKEEVAAY